MCLKLSVLGYDFDGRWRLSHFSAFRFEVNSTIPNGVMQFLESLLSYEIPEGDVYQSGSHSGSAWAALNDSSYDGGRLYSKRDSAKRNFLTGGLGSLVDRQIYTNSEIGKALEAPFSMRNLPWDNHQTLSGLVGWFCRSGLSLTALSPPCQSRNVSLLFTFNSGKRISFLSFSLKTLN